MFSIWRERMADETEIDPLEDIIKKLDALKGSTITQEVYTEIRWMINESWDRAYDAGWDAGSYD
jgi:hypothetical protein